MASKVPTPKGFRDFLPEQARARAFVLEKLKTTLERFGFEPLETTAIEFAETLKGKYGEEEKLIFEFTDRGGRSVALRFDQTVPLSRVVATNPNLPKPFKRYQIQPVWRAENPQKGRFREFIQVDFDTVGASSQLADAEIIAAAISATENLGFDSFVMKINDRETFRGLPAGVVRIIDKLPKIGETGVIEQLKRQGYDSPQAKALLKRLKDSAPTKNINKLFELLKSFKINPDKYAFDPTLARGLDYYTALIFELEIEDYSGGSVGGGGRYDDLIGRFTGSKIPATGFSFGFDRLLEAASEANLLPKYSPNTKVLVTVLKEQYLNDSLSLVSRLRDRGIAAEISLEPTEKLDKQLKYADNKGIPYAAILGPDEIKQDMITIKDLSSGKQEKLKESDLIKKLTIT
ncbi:MAG: histidine--tRNA ligase [Candidatus Woykebacteria bacterium RBG_16_43_9]|uniref:Histidine--tRNA ligase n=1 Tax=Candidatus Woykebacteria bacterium RBG_16_43_9 TaxID=1802596 RepID=A0A1G1WC92_9BACT|nr:MAG: histidine--tRNA ligase [Candidatus Woykebacteria bacterium RBG_16_43_9]